MDETGTSLITELFGSFHTDPNGLFDLPNGFTYKIISTYGDKVNDGFLVPHRSDRMATFPGPGGPLFLFRTTE